MLGRFDSGAKVRGVESVVTWVTAVVHVQVVTTAETSGVHGGDAQRGQLTAQLLDVTVLTVQGHLQLNVHLALV